MGAGHGGPSPEPVDCRQIAQAAPTVKVGHRVPALNIEWIPT